MTGLEPSPEAGREVWMDRLPSCGSSMDWTACTTFSVNDSLQSGRAWNMRPFFVNRYIDAFIQNNYLRLQHKTNLRS